MKHRPLKKVTKSPTILLCGVFVFFLICVTFYYGMHHDSRKKVLPRLHDVLYRVSYVLCALIVPTYLLAVSLNPGVVENKYNFIELVDGLLEKGLHLDNLCVYCEVLKSETSFHC